MGQCTQLGCTVMNGLTVGLAEELLIVLGQRQQLWRLIG